MKINWCKIIQIAYHITFAGGMFTGGEYYLEEARKIKNEVVQQVDRVESIAKSAQDQVSSAMATSTSLVGNATESVDNIADKISKIQNSIDKVEKTCKKVTGGLFR